MTNFFPNDLNTEVSLDKKQIVRLRGGILRVLRNGSLRGERLFILADQGPHWGYAVYDVRVRNNRETQRHPAHPEGTILLAASYLKSKEFWYDIATGVIHVPRYGTNGRAIWVTWQSYPSLMFRPSQDPDVARVMEQRAALTEARLRFLRAVMYHPESAPTVVDLICEELGVVRNSDAVHPAMKRILLFTPQLEVGVLNALREAIVASGPSANGPSDGPRQVLKVAA